MLTEGDSLTIMVHLGVALLAGGLIGLERSYHGRDAGFRTHVLVALSSALLMLVTLYQSRWFPDASALKVTSDPTRMAQGIMTGIGFLGAGVIIKDGLSVRGLTTAASIWITASIGILAGVGFYEPVLLATVLTLVALALFRWLENVLPSHRYIVLQISFKAGHEPTHVQLQTLLREMGLYGALSRISGQRAQGVIDYELSLRTLQADRLEALCEVWRRHEGVVSFSIQSPP